MKVRFIFLIIGLGFAMTLAVFVGQRLSSEAMAVIVGVVAGVAASIPTSLIVVWFATRTVVATREMPHPVAAPTPQPEPRVVMMPPAQFGLQGQMPLAQNFAGFPPQLYSAPNFPQNPMAAQFTPRQFNVIGGSEMEPMPSQPTTEVIWPR
jgi:hypothetical protein